MKLNSKQVFYFILDIFLKLSAILLPVVLLFFGSMFIGLETLHYFQRELGLFDIKTQPLNIYISGILILLAIPSIWLIYKTHAIYYFAIFSLILNGIFIFGAVIFILTPTADFLVGSLLFRKGFCTLLDRSVAISGNPNPEVKEVKNQFCIAASKIFWFDYPTKFSN